MPARTPLAQLRRAQLRRARLGRVPPGVWTAALWCAYTADSLRVYSGLPGMPREPSGLSLSASLAMAAAVAAAVAGSVLLRRRPLPAIGLLAAASVALAHYAAVDVALGFIVATRNRPTRIAALALTLAVIPGYARARMAFEAPAAGPPGWEVYVLTAVVAWLAGDSVRRGRNYAERLRAHAVAEAVTAERLRISRELHDLVAHSMGIITLQAGAAARVNDTQPQRARAAP